MGPEVAKGDWERRGRRKNDGGIRQRQFWQCGPRKWKLVLASDEQKIIRELKSARGGKKRKKIPQHLSKPNWNTSWIFHSFRWAVTWLGFHWEWAQKEKSLREQSCLGSMEGLWEAIGIPCPCVTQSSSRLNKTRCSLPPSCSASIVLLSNYLVCLTPLLFSPVYSAFCLSVSRCRSLSTFRDCVHGSIFCLGWKRSPWRTGPIAHSCS